VARDLRPTLAVRLVQLSELSVTRTGREEEKVKRASAEVRSREKKNSSSFQSRENFRKRNETRGGFENVLFRRNGGRPVKPKPTVVDERATSTVDRGFVIPRFSTPRLRCWLTGVRAKHGAGGGGPRDARRGRVWERRGRRAPRPHARDARAFDGDAAIIHGSRVRTCASSSGVHFSFFIAGLTLWRHRCAHCWPVFPGSSAATSAHRLP
jgi:hypothetical protein